MANGKTKQIGEAIALVVFALLSLAAFADAHPYMARPANAQEAGLVGGANCKECRKQMLAQVESIKDPMADTREPPTMKFPEHKRVTYEYFTAHASELTNGNKELEDAIRTSVNSTVALLEVKDGEEVVNGEFEYTRNGNVEKKKAYSGSGFVLHPCYIAADQHEVNRSVPLPDSLKGMIQAQPDYRKSPVGYRTTIRRKDAYTGVVEEIKGTVIAASGDPTVVQKDSVLIRLDQPLNISKSSSVGQSAAPEIPQGSAFYTSYSGDLQTNLTANTVVIDLGCSVKTATSGDGIVDTNCISSGGGSGGPISAYARNPKKGMGFNVIALATGGNSVKSVAVITESGFRMFRGETMASEIGNFGARFASIIRKQIKDRKAGDPTCPND